MPEKIKITFRPRRAIGFHLRLGRAAYSKIAMTAPTDDKPSAVKAKEIVPAQSRNAIMKVEQSLMLGCGQWPRTES